MKKIFKKTKTHWCKLKVNVKKYVTQKQAHHNSWYNNAQKVAENINLIHWRLSC